MGDARRKRQPPFAAGDRLNKKQIYRMAVGLFEESYFELQQVCFKDLKETGLGQDAELARVYVERRDIFDKKTQRFVEKTNTYILYYPGKDNALPVTPDDTIKPLNTIIESADKQLKAQMGEKAFGAATKIFLVGERNAHYCKPVNHWVMAMVDEENNLTIEDSIDRNYDESAVQAMIPHTKINPTVKRGWQNRLFDTWQDVHFVIHAIHRKINHFPDYIIKMMSKDIVEMTHAGYFKVGSCSIQKQLAIQRSKEKNTDNTERQTAKLDAFLKSIQAVNGYLKQRAEKTPIDFGLFTVYKGKDYYDRRASWKKILGKIKATFNNKNHTDLAAALCRLRDTIMQEADQFKSGNYYCQLSGLVAAINRMPMILSVNDAFINRLASYYDMYDEMDQYTAACKKLHQTNSTDDSGKVKGHKAAYGKLYANLNKEDQKQFLTMEKEHSAEYRHTFDY